LPARRPQARPKTPGRCDSEADPPPVWPCAEPSDIVGLLGARVRRIRCSLRPSWPHSLSTFSVRGGGWLYPGPENTTAKRGLCFKGWELSSLSWPAARTPQKANGRMRLLPQMQKVSHASGQKQNVCHHALCWTSAGGRKAGIAGPVSISGPRRWPQTGSLSN